MRLERRRLGQSRRSGSSRTIRDACGSTKPTPPRTGAYAARQLLATAEADPRYREGMTKRPSVPSIKITYVNSDGQPQKIAIREIFCRMDGDELVLTRFENAEGEKVKDLPIAVPTLDDLDDDVDDMDRLHELAMAELDDAPLPAAVESEPEPEEARPAPVRGRRLPTGPLRQYDETPAPAAPAADTPKPPPAPEPAPSGPPMMPPVAKAVERPSEPRPVCRFGRSMRARRPHCAP